MAPAWIGPVKMGWVLLKVTGIPWTERQPSRDGERTIEPTKWTTSSFIPWLLQGLECMQVRRAIEILSLTTRMTTGLVLGSETDSA